jgi:hypothetical protein
MDWLTWTVLWALKGIKKMTSETEWSESLSPSRGCYVERGLGICGLVSFLSFFFFFFMVLGIEPRVSQMP